MNYFLSEPAVADIFETINNNNLYRQLYAHILRMKIALRREKNN